MASDYSRVRELFQKAIELPKDQWPSFLAENCADDPECQSAVKRLLEHHQQDTLFRLDRTPRKTSSDTRAQGETLVSSELKIDQRGKSALTHSITQSIVEVLKTRLMRVWLIGIAIISLLALATYFLDRTYYHATRRSTEQLLETILDRQVAAIDMWLETEFRFVRTMSLNPELVDQIRKIDLVAREEGSTAKDIGQAGHLLRKLMDELAKEVSEFRYAVWNREYREIAATQVDSEVFGNGATDFGAQLLSRALQGENVFWIQSSRGYITRGFQPGNHSGKPDIALIVPVFAPDSQSPIAALLIAGFGMNDRFESMVNGGKFFDRGEVYSIDGDGFLITESRFTKQLKSNGWIPGDEAATSARIFRVADPGFDSSSYRPAVTEDQRSEWPLTRAARSLQNGIDGSDFTGYRNYRGVEVVGAWNWMDKYDIGIIAEIDYDSVFRAMGPLRWTYATLLGLGVLLSSLSFAQGIFMARRQAHQGIEHEIGPYMVDRLIGEGGLAFVYLAHHALLKRPTAIKQLKSSNMTPQNLVRFEREVRIASRLKHPNTIEIYDYGLTPKGNFYCAMEYIEGLTLQSLLDTDGPQSPERVVYILLEICRSLREAHGEGMLHRDIKPQNVMLSQRAGEFDCVKVLDFGLAKEIQSSASRATDTRVLVGTPMYIAPERIIDSNCMDPRSDIFSLGVLGFVLLTGKEPLQAPNSLAILSQITSTPAPRPSTATDRPIPPALDEIVFRCQARDPGQRYSTVGQLIAVLQNIEFEQPWNQDRARAWWRRLAK